MADLHVLDPNTVELVMSSLHPETRYHFSVTAVGSNMRTREGLKLKATATTSSCMYKTS